MGRNKIRNGPRPRSFAELVSLTRRLDIQFNSFSPFFTGVPVKCSATSGIDAYTVRKSEQDFKIKADIKTECALLRNSPFLIFIGK